MSIFSGDRALGIASGINSIARDVVNERRRQEELNRRDEIRQQDIEFRNKKFEEELRRFKEQRDFQLESSKKADERQEKMLKLQLMIREEDNLRDEIDLIDEKVKELSRSKSKESMDTIKELRARRKQLEERVNVIAKELSFDGMPQGDLSSREIIKQKRKEDGDLDVSYDNSEFTNKNRNLFNKGMMSPYQTISPAEDSNSSLGLKPEDIGSVFRKFDQGGMMDKNEDSVNLFNLLKNKATFGGR